MSLPSSVAPSSATAKYFDGLDTPQSPLHRAAAGSRTPFATLVSIASAESGFDANAKARRSSATGPFQFTEQTWLQLVKRHGTAQGRADLAGLIQIDNDGVASVTKENREAVLGARRDVGLSSAIAAKLCDENRATLARKLGRQPGEPEVRMAFFLGGGGAARLIQAAETTPDASVKSLLSPRAYANHKSMFVENGRPLTAGEAVDSLTKRYTQELAVAKKPAVQAQANSLLTAQHLAQVAKLNEISPSTGLSVALKAPDAAGAAVASVPTDPNVGLTADDMTPYSEQLALAAELNEIAPSAGLSVALKAPDAAGAAGRKPAVPAANPNAGISADDMKPYVEQLAEAPKALDCTDTPDGVNCKL